jgi:tRNA (guanine37-N1)-methyltransferase
VTLFAILTLFPEALEPYVRESILGIAQSKGAIEVRLVDFRDFARDRHRSVDDRPFGGGPGMLLRPEPVVECIEWLEDRHGPFRKLALCPTGRRFDQRRAEELAREERVLLLCGRYEGFDERIFEELELERLSIGDFVLAGGELPALCVVEAAARLMPGVLGCGESAERESFAPDPRGPRGLHGPDGTPGLLLDTPHYTRPRVFRGRAVPDVLLSGDHAAIEAWRRQAAWKRTREARPELIDPRIGPRGPETDRTAPDRNPRDPDARPTPD